jgi:hypothetical protein
MEAGDLIHPTSGLMKLERDLPRSSAMTKNCRRARGRTLGGEGIEF